MTIRTAFLAAAGLLAITTGAYAAPITGNFSITGPAPSAGNGAGGIVTVNMSNTMTFGVIGSFTASGGSLASLRQCQVCTAGTGGTLNFTNNNSGTFGPVQTTFSPTSTNPLFDLSAFNGLQFSFVNPITISGTGPSGATPATLTISGSILLHETNLALGLDDTLGNFVITSNGSSVNASFSASGASPVPEPASIALLGGSLAVLGMLRRRQSK